MSSFLHAVNALAWRVQHKLTLHWGYGLELMLMPDLKEVISAWLVFSETLHPPCKFRLATQGSATGREEITYTANQHMASEKKKQWDSPCRAQRLHIRVPVVPLWKWSCFTLTLFSLRLILFERNSSFVCKFKLATAKVHLITTLNSCTNRHKWKGDGEDTVPSRISNFS